MANGFFLNETASMEIGAERRMVRHSGNTSDATWQILRSIRVFSATPKQMFDQLMSLLRSFVD
jgi:hypothetical protein